MRPYFSQHWQSLIPLTICTLAAITAAGVIASFEAQLPSFELEAAQIIPGSLTQFSKTVRHTSAFALLGASFVLLELFSIAVSSMVIYRSLSHRSMRYKKNALLITFAIGSILIASLSPVLVNLKSYTHEIVSFINQNIGSSMIKPILVGGNLLMCATVWFAAVACGAILSPSDLDQNTEEQILQSRMELSRLLLYVLAVLLVTGTLSIRSLFALPAVWLNDAHSEEMYEVATSISIVAGAIGSLFLVCTYVPTQLMLIRRASILSGQRYIEDNSPNASDWLVEKGLTTGYGGQIPALIALLGPMLTGGPLKDFVGSLLS